MGLAKLLGSCLCGRPHLAAVYPVPAQTLVSPDEHPARSPGSKAEWRSPVLNPHRCSWWSPQHVLQCSEASPPRSYVTFQMGASFMLFCLPESLASIRWPVHTCHIIAQSVVLNKEICNPDHALNKTDRMIRGGTSLSSLVSNLHRTSRVENVYVDN